ncbi:MAG: hypothetical protein ABI665_07255 [Vicinamibacterales bacterium]
MGTSEALTNGRLGATAASRGRAARALLASFMLAGVVGVWKGLAPALDPRKEFYWLFSYQYGFIRRGLMGTLVHPLLKVWSFADLKPMIIGAHVIACVAIIVALQMFFQDAVRRNQRWEARITLALSFLCLMGSPLMPVLAHDAGYVDVYLMAVVLTALWFVVHERYVAAALTVVIGPLIHEGFVFLWCPVAIMLAWSCAMLKADRAKKLILAAVPFLCTVGVIWYHDQTALRLSMAAWPASDEVKGAHMAYTFGQTLHSSFDHMSRYEFPGHWGNFMIAVAYSLVPSLLLLWAAVFCYWQRWTARWPTLLVAVAATLSPLPIVALGWDLSRFLSWSNLAAAIVLIGAGAPTLTSLGPDDA